MLNDVFATTVHAKEGKVGSILRTGSPDSGLVPHFFELTPAMARAFADQLLRCADELDPPAPQSTQITP